MWNKSLNPFPVFPIVDPYLISNKLLVLSSVICTNSFVSKLLNNWIILNSSICGFCIFMSLILLLSFTLINNLALNVSFKFSSSQSTLVPMCIYVNLVLSFPYVTLFLLSYILKSVPYINCSVVSCYPI